MHSNTYSEDNVQKKGPERQVFYKIICLFSIILNGIAFFGVIAGLFFSGKLNSFFNEYSQGGSFPAVRFYVISLLFILVLLASTVYGAALMLKLKKTGYYFYLVPQSLLLVPAIVFFFFTMNKICLIYIALSIALILLYASYIKRMR